MKITGIKNWQILQQKDGYASADIIYEVSGYLKNPETEDEKRIAPLFKRIRVKISEENTGRSVTDWIVSDEVGSEKCFCKIDKIPVGGPYRLQMDIGFENDDGSEFWYQERKAIRHFGVGDVFLIAGQSNAAGWAFGEYDDEGVVGVSSYIDGEWDMASHPLGGAGVGPFLSYAKYLKKKLGYPIGLIPRAIGGSPISAWVSGGIYTEKIRKEREQGLCDIKAVLWYQGCTDAEKKETVDIYEAQFMNFLNEIRSIFDDNNLPVITFQLNRLRNDCFDREWGYNNIREIQRQIAKKADNCYIIPTIDLTHMSDPIHNGCDDNYHLGQRAARFVLDKLYKAEKNYISPEFNCAEAVGDKEVRVKFDNVVNNLIWTVGRNGDYPIRITDKYGIIPIEKLDREGRDIKIYLIEKLGEDAKISINCGINPDCIIFDDISKLPVICTYNEDIKSLC